MFSPLLSLLKSPHRDHVLIACMPKSGSTYLHALLRDITGLPDGCVSEWGDQNEGDICERRLRRLKRRSVMQQHLKATETNLMWMVKYNVRPIVQIRSLFDVVPSIHDHLKHAKAGLPCGCICRDFWHMNWEDRCEYLIQTHLPWYFNFLISWREAVAEIEICSIAYEDLFSDQVGSLTRVLDFYRIHASQEQIAAAIARASKCDTRFNVGVAGRGSQKLTSRQKLGIRKMAQLCGFELAETGEAILPFPQSQPGMHVAPLNERLRIAA